MSPVVLVLAGLVTLGAIAFLLRVFARRGGGQEGNAQTAGQVLDQIDALFDGDDDGRWDRIDRLKTPPPGDTVW